MPSVEEIKGLFAEFPREAISWRAQTMTKDGSKAMALAYIDARDVMERLDAICGPENWQDRYEFDGPRTICYLSVRIGDEWITKADGAGDTQVEAEKGSISGAFKRAAVKWGIGRYLYDLPAPWVPCECRESNGKKFWSKWSADPWSFVKSKTSAPTHQAENKSKAEARPIFQTLQDDMRRNRSKAELRRWLKDSDVKELRAQIPHDWNDNLTQLVKDLAATLPEEVQSELLAG